MSEDFEELEIVVQVTDREDGGIRIRSRDIPGILLGGSDAARIWSTVGAVVEHALRHDRGLDVRRVIGPMITPDTRGDVTLRVVYASAPARAAA